MLATFWFPLHQVAGQIKSIPAMLNPLVRVVSNPEPLALSRKGMERNFSLP